MLSPLINRSRNGFISYHKSIHRFQHTCNRSLVTRSGLSLHRSGLSLYRSAARAFGTKKMSRFEPITEFPVLDTLMEDYREVIGDQFEAYSNHLKRVINFCILLHPDYTKDEFKRFEIAAVFHDIGLWTHQTVDYLEPSVEVAKKYLKDNDLEVWSRGEIEMMILDHHKVTKCIQKLVDIFRKSDWIDITMGVRKFGLEKEDINKILETFPNLGFHANLNKLALQEIKNKKNPLPMMKW